MAAAIAAVVDASVGAAVAVVALAVLLLPPAPLLPLRSLLPCICRRCCCHCHPAWAMLHAMLHAMLYAKALGAFG